MTDRRSYTIATVRALLDDMPRRTFFTLKARGALPFLEELKPRLGRRIRYRADLVDRYLANQWGRPRAVAAQRKLG